MEWDYESLLSLHTADIDMRITRVGFVRYEDGVEPEEEEALTKALGPFSCVPVFLEKPLVKKFYRDFCKVKRGLVSTPCGLAGVRSVLSGVCFVVRFVARKKGVFLRRLWLFFGVVPRHLSCWP